MRFRNASLKMLFGLGLAVLLSLGLAQVAVAGAGCCANAAGFAEWDCCHGYHLYMSSFTCSSFPGGCTSDYTCYGGNCLS